MNPAFLVPAVAIASLLGLSGPAVAAPCSVLDTDLVCVDLVDESVIHLGCDDPADGFQSEHTILTVTAAGEVVQAYGQDGCSNDDGLHSSSQSVAAQYYGTFGSVQAGYDYSESPYSAPSCTLRLYYETFVAGHDGFQPVSPLVCEALDLVPWGQLPV